MKKISVASVPPIFQLVANEDEDEGSVVCQGLTAKLHSRFGRFEDGNQVSECVKRFRLKLCLQREKPYKEQIQHHKKVLINSS